MDPESLSEDADAFSAHFQGQLSFKNENTFGITKDSSVAELSFEVDDRLLQAGPVNVTFEVINAQIVKESHSKYVVYTVLLASHPGMDKIPITIDRRYTDFNKLDRQMRKAFPDHMKGVAFPKKLLTGNFKPATVAQRSRAFEQYLTHLFSVDEIRLAPEFTMFFCGDDLTQGYEHIYNGQYNEAIALLERVLNIEKKILGYKHRNVIYTLCALVVCHSAMEREQQAQLLAETALQYIGDNSRLHCLVPLLNLTIHLCWKLGKQKADLEERLIKLKEAGHDVTGSPTLLEIVVRRFQKKDG